MASETLRTELFSLSWPREDVALVTFDAAAGGAPGGLEAFLDELEETLAALAQRDDVAGLVLRGGHPESVVTGAALLQLVARPAKPREEVLSFCRRGQHVLRRLNGMPFVTVACVDGAWLGPGAQLALWCDRRVFASGARTEFGFPEVMLGWVPAWGGTARLPRIVGLAAAIELICSGAPIGAEAAARLGLATKTAPRGEPLEAAIQLVRREQRSREFVADSQRWSEPLAGDAGEREALRRAALAQIERETRGCYPAPAAALSLLLSAASRPLEEALEREAETVGELFESPLNPPLNPPLGRVYALVQDNERALRPLSAIASPDAPGPLAIVGAGVMGSGIAATALEAGLPVFLTDSSPAALDRAHRQILREVAGNPWTGQADAARASRDATLLQIGDDAVAAGAGLVLESIVENVAIKQELLGRLESRLRPGAILASNTSSIPITKLAERLARPERFCGIHFFTRRSRLVEIIRGAHTSDETLAVAVAFVRQIGRIPLVVNDGPAFLVNRLLFPVMNEAIELLLDGASPREIDAAATSFGLPLGPIEIFDTIGLDIAAAVGRNMWSAFPGRVGLSPLVVALLQAGRLGKKAGRGFYAYPEGDVGEDDPAATALVEKYRRNRRNVPAEEVLRRSLLVMLLEATRVLDEGIARSVRDVDLGVLFALGFPAQTGGLLAWADSIGAKTILSWLEPFAALGPRMRPTERLLWMAQRGETFYSAYSAAGP